MEWTNYQILLALIMVITGSINTLSTKWADEIKSIGRNGVEKKFEHPFFQASTMFLGELFCLIAFKILYKFYSRRAIIASATLYNILKQICGFYIVYDRFNFFFANLPVCFTFVNDMHLWSHELVYPDIVKISQTLPKTMSNSP